MRPALLDDIRADQIINAIENGLPRKQAAAVVGISERALQNWIARGRQELERPDIDPRQHSLPQLRQLAVDRGTPLDGARTKVKIAEALNDHETMYMQFVQRLVRADAASMGYGLQEAIRTGKEDWRFWMLFLERRYPAEFGRRDPDDADLTDVDVGTEEEAALMLERATEIRIKMIGTGR